MPRLLIERSTSACDTATSKCPAGWARLPLPLISLSAVLGARSSCTPFSQYVSRICGALNEHVTFSHSGCVASVVLEGACHLFLTLLCSFMTHLEPNFSVPLTKNRIDRVTELTAPSHIQSYDSIQDLAHGMAVIVNSFNDISFNYREWGYAQEAIVSYYNQTSGMLLGLAMRFHGHRYPVSPSSDALLYSVFFIPS